jgi:hypothetical protein
VPFLPPAHTFSHERGIVLTVLWLWGRQKVAYKRFPIRTERPWPRWFPPPEPLSTSTPSTRSHTRALSESYVHTTPFADVLLALHSVRQRLRALQHGLERVQQG